MSLKSGIAIAIRVTGIKARVFDNTRRAYELMRALLDVKRTDASMWKWVNDDFLIVESYYVTSFLAEFKGSGDFSAKGEFERAGQKFEGGVECKWHNESTLEMIGTPSVPLAVRGLKV
jgi:hypothetical protein